MNRLFTFGCSFTNYVWPTWADFVGTKFTTYQNWGRAGAGNYYILSKLIECNRMEKITKDDVVMVMFTSSNRCDIILPNSEYTTIGNIYCEKGFEIFGEHFLKNTWTIEHGVYNSWMSINAVKLILDGIGCKYKLMTGFDFYSIDHHNPPTVVEPTNARLKACLEDLDKIFQGKDLNNFSINNYDRDVLSYRFNGQIDHHPTVTIHHDWVKEILPDFYDNDMVQICEIWEKKVSQNRTKTFNEFREEKMYGLEWSMVQKKLF